MHACMKTCESLVCVYAFFDCVPARCSRCLEKIERDMEPIMALRSRFSLKTIADATMTTTRLAVFITDEVTGPT